MQRRRVTIRRARIPFRTVFKHASAARTIAENVIVLIEDEDGLVGYGEGCPRPYVTGESQESAQAFLHRRAESVAVEVDSVAALHAWISGDREIDANPSAACALELALLDLLGRRAVAPVERLLGLEPIAVSPRATAVYGDSSPLAFAAQYAAFGWNGMRDSKLKLSGDPQRDRRRARWLARRGPVRFDANNLWADSAASVPKLAPLARYAWAVEEPVKARDFEGMAKISRETGLAIILDESFLVAADLDVIPTDGTFVVNVRVSKLGGLIRTLKALRDAGARGVKVVVGAQVGETSILARAGLVAVSAAAQAMLGYEGGYGVHLLAHDVCSPSLTFGRQGAFSANILSCLSRPGLGLDRISLLEGSGP